MKKSLIYVFAGMIPLGYGPCSVHAQPQTPSNATNSPGLEEVIVTAQRRAESLQDVPIAIAVVTGEEISRSNVSRPSDLAMLVPSLQINDSHAAYSNYYMRGVGFITGNTFADPALTFNFGEVTVNKAGTSGFFYDLERVEVLKGPQGTLYGRNATGGAINVIPSKPVLGEYGGDASFQYGNYDAIRVDAALNVPIGDRAALRIAGFQSQHDGYMTDGTDENEGTGGRISLAYRPSESLNVLLIADYFHQGSGLAAPTISAVIDPSATTPPPFTIDDRVGIFDPRSLAYSTSQLDNNIARNFSPYENTADNDNSFWGVSAAIDWSSAHGTLTLIPAYRTVDLDYERWDTGIMIREEDNETDQVTLEARFASKEDRSFRYLIGAYYLNEDLDAPRFDVNQQSNFNHQEIQLQTDSYAAFASLSYDILPDLSVTGGARYTKEDKSFTGLLEGNLLLCFSFACPLAEPFPYSQREAVPVPMPFGFDPVTDVANLGRNVSVSDEQSYNKLTYRLAVDWSVSDENMLYASYETGFKAGGYHFSADDATYGPEELNAWTLGSKNRFFDERLQLNLELYHWTYQDLQYPHLSEDSSGNAVFITENVGKATMKGVDLELNVQMTDNARLTANLQFNDSEYDRFVFTTPNFNGGINNETGCPDLIPPGAAYTVDCSGKTPPQAPEWSAGANWHQIFPLSNGAKMRGNVRGHYQSETVTGSNFLPQELQEGYSRWDMDLTYYTPEEKFYIGAYVQNLFDKTARALTDPVPFTSFMVSTLRPPRTYGVRVGLSF